MELHTESGTYTFESTNAVGCDSRLLNLTINNCSDIATACDTLIGMEQRILRVVHILLSLLMLYCDSTATLNLTINNSSSSEDVTACDSFDWNGTTYTESGTYTFATTNAVGCDSTATLNLTINNSSSSSEDIIITDSSYEWNGTTYTESGIYTFELPIV